MGNQKKHAVGVIGENDEILMVRKTHPTEKFMPANNDEPQLAYTVQERNAHFEICAASGRVVLVYADEGSAAHYAALLNEAHRAGYKLGYRDGRNN
jgi:hypothetical protein